MADDVIETYQSSLDDLKVNSKPHISMLTMLAEDHEQYASDIVRVIEEQIKKVPVARKLPIMYLIDSIIKNLSTTLYPQLFAQCIVQIFCGVFEEVDEKTRQAMYKLRQTWPDIIPNKQLYLLDRKVQLIDPAWPITAKAPEHGVIHVNPKFLKPKEKDERSPQFSPVHSDSSLDEAIREELYAKEKELQKLRLELELAETKAKLEQQKKQLEQQAMQKSSKNVIDREPPPVIKLPPASTSPVVSNLANRDPRLSRDPRMSRDPRLKRQQEKQEQESLEMEKEMSEVISKPFVDATKMVGPPPVVGTAAVDSVSSTSSSSSRMDLATLLHSFSNAAAKVAAEQAKKKNQFVHSAEPEVIQNSPESLSQKNIPSTQPKSDDTVTLREEPNISGKNPSKPPKIESKSDRKSTENEKMKESKVISPKVKDMKTEVKDSKREVKKWSPHGKDKEKANNDREKRDNKGIDKRDSKEKDRRDSKEKDRQDSKDLDHSRDRRDSRERRSDSDMNRHNSRRVVRGRSSPDFRHGGHRDGRQNRMRERERHSDTVIQSADGRTDQFGRMLRRSKSGSRSRDRSPLSRDKERVSVSPKVDDREKQLSQDKSHEETSPYTVTSQDKSPKSEAVFEGVIVKTEMTDIVSSYSIPTSEPSIISEGDLKTEDVVSMRNKGEFHFKKEDSSESRSDTMEVDHVTKNQLANSMKSENTEVLQAKEGTEGSVNSSEDVDMRIQQQVVIIKKEEQDDDMDVRHSEKSEDATDSGDSQAAKMKRPYSVTDESRPDVRPYKIPKLGPKKFDNSTDENREDISKLFGEEDVDYRHQALQGPPSLQNQNLLPSAALNMKSPAQRRWSQFKESHPDDFAQDMERKRLRDAQMQSITSGAHDVDLRPLTSRQRSLPLPPLDPTVSIPKDLSAENQEQILQRAEQELKEGRISHGDHQEIIRQLGQVYDIQKKRLSFEERPSRTLDLRDPRLRGIRENRTSYPEDIDRRVPYLEVGDDHRRGPSRPHLPAQSHSGDGSDEPANNSPRYRDRHENFRAGYEISPKEDFDARRLIRPRHDHRMEYERQRVKEDFDGRSPRDLDSAQQHSVRDLDDRLPHRFRDFDVQSMRDVDRFDEVPSRDFDARQSLHNEDDRHDYRNENLRGSFDEFNGSGHMRGPVLRGEVPQHDVRGPAVRDDRLDDVHSVRRNTPPSDKTFRGPPDTVEGIRPHGQVGGPHIREPFINHAPRLGSVPDIQGPPLNFPNPLVGPEQRMPIPLGPRSVVPGKGPAVPMNQDLVRQTGAISDPMDDPRWSAMRGLLDNEGTEELVIDGKPFELRMGTSRKLRIYGKVMDVAVDLKERGIRVDGQLVYKLGEPIKEVPAIGRTVRLYYHGLPKPIWLDRQQHEMRMDAPPRNIVVDGVRRGFQIDGRDMMILVDRIEKGPYGGPPRMIRIAGVDHEIAFQAPPRRILIDNKTCELKLDSRIPYVVIDGKPHGIRFDGKPRTVFINDQPFTIPVDRAEKIRIGNRPTYIAFGGPAHEIIIDGKWFEVKFDNIPKDIHLGNRHFSVRIPGPLPRVKILDELPHNFDESRLMSSNKAMVQQPGQPTHVPGLSDSSVSRSVPLSGPFLHGHDISKGPEGEYPQEKPIPDSMHHQELAGSEGIHNSAPQSSEVIHPQIHPAIDNIRPNITSASEGILRPIGSLNSESIRFGQPSQMTSQSSLPVVSQQPPGPTPMLLQSNPLHHGSNPVLGLERPNLIGFAGIPQSLQNPRMLQPQPQPVNLLAQGLLRHVASTMMNSTLQGLPDFAAGLRALTQQITIQQQPQVPLRHPTEDDHGAAMVTGMQGSSFMGLQKPQPIMPPKPSVPLAPISQPPPLPRFTGAQGFVLPGLVTTTTSSVIPTTTAASSAPANPAMDINSLLSKLVQVGLIKETPKADAVPAEKSPPSQSEPVLKTGQEKPIVTTQEKQERVPDLVDFDSDKLKQTYKSVIDQLHEGIQCHTCAARFTMNDHEKYRAHLDWHFRQNKMEQEMVKVAKNRKWFYSIPDWIQYEELEDTIEKSRSEIFEQMRLGEDEPSGGTQTISVRALEGKEVIKNPVATGIEGEDVCATCGDPFDQMWNEETEEWILKNTIKVDGKTYHPVCYEDAQETPTPVTVLTKNPLEVQLQDMSKTVDSSNTSLQVEVKTEPMEVKTEPIDTTEEPPTPIEKPVTDLLVKAEIKTEPGIENNPPEMLKTSSASSDKDSAIKNSAATSRGTPRTPDTTPKAAPSNTTEVISCQGPTLLSTIATTVVREVIPVSQEDPNSPWEMDSNPTPELSRTPTPEIIPSFTPAPSVSSESLSSLAQGSDCLTSEEPLPPSLLPAGNRKNNNPGAVSVKLTEDSASSQPVQVKDELKKD